MPSALPDVVRYHLPWAAKASKHAPNSPRGKKSGWEAWWGQQGEAREQAWRSRPGEAYRKWQGKGMVFTVGRG